MGVHMEVGQDYQSLQARPGRCDDAEVSGVDIQSEAPLEVEHPQVLQRYNRAEDVHEGVFLLTHS